jgi:hypothetical protein
MVGGTGCPHGSMYAYQTLDPANAARRQVDIDIDIDT